MATSRATVSRAATIPRAKDAPFPSDRPPDSAVHKWEGRHCGVLLFQQTRDDDINSLQIRKSFHFWRNLISKKLCE